MRERYRQIFPTAVLFSAGLIWIGFLLDEPGNIITGLYRIVVSENILITDYVYIAGPGAALINSGIVTGISICILKFSGASFNGDTIVKMGLMSGFSLFGKNFFNIWPIILGSWLYAVNFPRTAGQLYDLWKQIRKCAIGAAVRGRNRICATLPVILHIQNTKRNESLQHGVCLRLISHDNRPHLDSPR